MMNKERSDHNEWMQLQLKGKWLLPSFVGQTKEGFRCLTRFAVV